MENRAQSTISRGVEITGTIKSDGAVHIDGKIDGEILCQGKVTIGESAQIKGNIRSNVVVVEGSITGNLTAKDKIHMKSTAKVSGDIQSKRLAVEDGVTFVGNSEVNPVGATGGAPPVPETPKKAKEQSAEKRAAAPGP